MSQMSDSVFDSQLSAKVSIKSWSGRISMIFISAWFFNCCQVRIARKVLVVPVNMTCKNMLSECSKYVILTL